ncbi:MAG: hypothetical protein HY000_04610, partial [Planctomycetes bacterium]|nr:hypothetical protein [Planctomycetota bacterium]
MSTGQDFQAGAREVGRELRQLRSNMPSFVELAVFLILFVVSLGLAVFVGQRQIGLGITIAVVGVVLSGLVAASIKVANQWERGIVLRLGEFHTMRGPGLFVVLPIIDRVRMVDTRVLAVDIP